MDHNFHIMKHSSLPIELSLTEIINLITAANLIILFIILFFRHQNSLPNRILGIILLLPAFSFINNYIVLSGFVYKFPSIVFITQLIVILGPPLIYYYIKLLIGNKRKLFFILNVLTLLLWAVCIYFFVRFLLFDEIRKFKFAEQITNEAYPLYLTYIRGGFFVLLNAYFIVIAWQVIQHSKKVKEFQSELELYKLRYLQQFVMLMWVLNLIISVLYLTVANYYIDFIAVPIVITVFYFFLLRTAFAHTALFSSEKYERFKKQLADMDKLQAAKKGNLNFSEKQVTHIKDKLNALMRDEQLFLYPDLNILKLAQALDLKVHQTSYFINNYLNSNFFNLINSYRIEQAKEKMRKAGTNAEIEVIGFEVGFNSKSAFYRAFNKFVRQSPSQFIESL